MVQRQVRRHGINVGSVQGRGRRYMVAQSLHAIGTCPAESRRMSASSRTCSTCSVDVQRRSGIYFLVWASQFLRLRIATEGMRPFIISGPKVTVFKSCKLSNISTKQLCIRFGRTIRNRERTSDVRFGVESNCGYASDLRFGCNREQHDSESRATKRLQLS